MTRVLLSILAALAALFALLQAAASQQPDRDGFYCVNGPAKRGTYSFALKQRPNSNLDFGVSLWWPDGKSVSIIGVAKPSGNGWRFEASSPDHCVVTIEPQGRGFGIAIDRAACESYGGFNAVPSKVVFTGNMRQGPAGTVLANSEKFIDTECRAKPSTSFIPLTVEWETGGESQGGHGKAGR